MLNLLKKYKNHFLNLYLERQRESSSKINQLRYLSQSVLIEEMTTPYAARIILFIISIITILLIIWSGLTQIREIAATTGEVIPSKYIQSIQYLEGGIIDEIKVTEGELVKQGQVLFVMDGTAIKQDLLALQAKKLSLTYKELKLKSLINNTVPNFNTVIKSNVDTAPLIDEQLESFKSMIDSNNKDKAIIIEQIAAKRSELASLNEKQITLQDNMRLIEQERALKQKLNDKGYLSTIQLLQTKKQFNDLKGRIQDNDAQITQAENSISEYTTKLSALSANFKEEAYKELMTTQTDLSQIEENIKKLNEQVGRLNIVSPSDGIVKVLNIKTIGGVVESAQVLAQIVPLEGQLILETRIDPKDIGYINIGQKANVKISAYDFSRYGTVEGNVEYISATTFSNPDNSKYYTCRISIAKNYIGTDPTKNLIIPGMAVQADIVTGSKSLLAYLLKPINNSLTTAFSEK